MNINPFIGLRVSLGYPSIVFVNTYIYLPLFIESKAEAKAESKLISRTNAVAKIAVTN